MTWSLLPGDCLDVLRTLPDESVDAVITDPPYSSGGLFRGDRTATVRDKYQSGGTHVTYPDFAGDARDQRAWTSWCAQWLTELYRIVRPGGYVLLFTDWRQLPATTDALQWAAFVWRGLIAWDKTGAARAPHTGYFRHQCEYIVWGSKGHLGKADGRGPFPGCISTPIRPAEKQHVTAKPIALLEQLVRCCPPGGHILDPFAGSGTTGVAAVAAGYTFTGIEREPAYVAISNTRIAQAAALARSPA